MLTIALPTDKVLMGKEFGIETRELIDLDRLDKIPGITVCIIINHQTWAINSSFFIGCFLDSIRHLGKYKFEDRYRFAYEDEYLRNMVEDNIRRCEKMITSEEKANVSDSKLSRYFHI